MILKNLSISLKTEDFVHVLAIARVLVYFKLLLFMVGLHIRSRTTIIIIYMPAHVPTQIIIVQMTIVLKY